MSQSHNELSTTAPSLEAGQDGGWGRVKVEGRGVALSSLWPWNHWLVFTVDVGAKMNIWSVCLLFILKGHILFFGHVTSVFD